MDKFSCKPQRIASSCFFECLFGWLGFQSIFVFVIVIATVIVTIVAIIVITDTVTVTVIVRDIVIITSFGFGFVFVFVLHIGGDRFGFGNALSLNDLLKLYEECVIMVHIVKGPVANLSFVK